MECKFQRGFDNQAVINELIDTLWNVNILLQQIKIKVLTELIDTLWNVNTHRISRKGKKRGINRYIMECK